MQGKLLFLFFRIFKKATSFSEILSQKVFIEIGGLTKLDHILYK